MEVGDWMTMETYHTHYDPHHELRMEARGVAREMWVVYQEFVDAGFNEEQALALTVNLMVEEE
jgi:hypothetical protein